MATRVPREPHEIRILNPYFIQEAAFSFIGLPFNNGLMGRGVGIKQRKDVRPSSRGGLHCSYLSFWPPLLDIEREGLWLCYSGSSQAPSDPGKNLPDPRIFEEIINTLAVEPL